MDYQEILKEVSKNSYFFFALARLSFGKAKYEEALNYLSQIDHNDALRSSQARYLEIACYYEQQLPTEFILDKCAAFTLFLNRKVKHLKELSEGCKNFNKIVRDLLVNKSTKMELLRVLENQELIVFKQWLLEKINQKK